MTRTRPLAVLVDGPVPVCSAPSSLAPVMPGRRPPDLLVGWSPGPVPWLDALLEEGDAGPDEPVVRTLMAGYGLRRAGGRIGYVSVRLSAVERLMGHLRPELAVVPVVRRGQGFALRSSVGWALSAVRHAEGLVLEVDEEAEDLGLPSVHGRVVEVRPVRVDEHAYTAPEPGPVEQAIAVQVAGLVPEGATLQFGPGAIAAGVVEALGRPVRVASGLVTDSLVRLADRGLLVGTATSSYDWGGESTRELHRQGLLRMLPIDVSNDPGTIARTERFIAVNTAIQVGLDGSVNVERAADRVVAGVGGHADFCAGAARSPGGLSVIAVPSTAGGRSTIVPRVDLVSTGRTDVDVVVTEHGVADLRGRSQSERERLVLGVAAPENREELAHSSAG